MTDTMQRLYELAGSAGYECRDRDIVLRHLQRLAEALWPTGHLDQIAQACASHYDEGEAAAIADHQAQENDHSGEPSMRDLPDPDHEAMVAYERQAEERALRIYGA